MSPVNVDPTGGEIAPCLRRIRAWRVPPHYSQHDWMDEMRAHCWAAALSAKREYDPRYQVPLATFVYQRVMAAALARYRQEWSYSVRCVAPFEDDSTPSPVTADAYGAVDLRQWLDTGLLKLSDRDRWMVRRLYSDRCTEAEVASELHVSQQAVSKHKEVVLRHLRTLLTKTGRHDRAIRSHNAGS